jgi:hypothetical protein
LSSRASITVLGSPEEIQRHWGDPQYRPDYIETAGASVRFVAAPGDRGTEIHVELAKAGPSGTLSQAVAKLRGAAPLAKVKDDLRRFKQQVETGEIPRSEAVPEGELAERKLKQRPAQPLSQDELQKVGV